MIGFYLSDKICDLININVLFSLWPLSSQGLHLNPTTASLSTPSSSVWDDGAMPSGGVSCYVWHCSITSNNRSSKAPRTTCSSLDSTQTHDSSWKCVTSQHRLYTACAVQRYSTAVQRVPCVDLWSSSHVRATAPPPPPPPPPTHTQTRTHTHARTRLLPSWLISAWALRWTRPTASPPRSCSHRCCSCSLSTRSISPPRSRSPWHIWWLASPPPCCPLPTRSSHPGAAVTGEKAASGDRTRSSAPTFASHRRRRYSDAEALPLAAESKRWSRSVSSLLG